MATLGLTGCAHDTPRAPAAAPGAVLDQATVVRRCLPQLTRAATFDGSPVRVAPLSVRTLLPAKPFVAHHTGDLVAFFGTVRGGPRGQALWGRLDRICRVPASEQDAAPGSQPLPGSATRPSRTERARDLQLCTEAPDLTALPDGTEVDPSQVVAPDVRGARLVGEAWGPAHVGVQVLADRNDYRAFRCDLGLYGTTIQVVAPTRTLTPVAYLNGDRRRPAARPDRYYVAGALPSVGDAQAQPARTIEVTPPGRPSQRFPVRVTGLAGDGGVGSYAFVVAFRPVTAALGSRHTAVRLLAAHDRVLWSGLWDVGIEGH